MSLDFTGITDPNVTKIVPRGYLAGHSNDGTSDMHWRIESALTECEEDNAYWRTQPEWTEEEAKKPDPVYDESDVQKLVDRIRDLTKKNLELTRVNSEQRAQER